MKRDATPSQNPKRHDADRAPSRPLLTRAGVEARYGVRKRYLELAPARGDGPPLLRIGRSVYYRPEDVEAWLESLIVDPTEGRR